MNSFFDGLVVTCDEIVESPGITLINPNNKTNYWLVVLGLLAITFLLLLVVITVKYCMVCGLAILCLLSY